MVVYDIYIDYTTGNSFNSERVHAESVGIATTNLEKAKENLRRIEQHYKEHHDSPDYGKRYELELLTDDGSRTICPFWIGYFETLHGAKISVEDDEMSFEL